MPPKAGKRVGSCLDDSEENSDLVRVTRYSVPKAKRRTKGSRVNAIKSQTTHVASPEPAASSSSLSDAALQPLTDAHSNVDASLPIFPFSSDPSWSDPHNHTHIGETSITSGRPAKKRRKTRADTGKRQRKRRVCLSSYFGLEWSIQLQSRSVSR